MRIKKLTALMLSVILSFAFAACTKTEPVVTEPDEQEPEESVEIPNPFVTYDNYDQLMSAAPGIALAPAPQGATNVTYSSCQPEGKLEFVQCDFTLGEDTYCYRAASCKSEANVKDDLHGYYYDFTKDETVKTASGESYRLRTYDADGIGVGSWYSSVTSCQYTLTAHTSQDPATVIAAAADLLVGYTPEK